MAMSNYWINMRSEGRRSTLKGGVGTGRENGMELEVRVRDGGESIVVYRIHGFVDAEGNISTRVLDRNGNEVDRTETVR